MEDGADLAVVAQSRPQFLAHQAGEVFPALPPCYIEKTAIFARYASEAPTAGDEAQEPGQDAKEGGAEECRTSPLSTIQSVGDASETSYPHASSSHGPGKLLKRRMSLKKSLSKVKTWYRDLLGGSSHATKEACSQQQQQLEEEEESLAPSPMSRGLQSEFMSTYDSIPDYSILASCPAHLDTSTHRAAAAVKQKGLGKLHSKVKGWLKERVQSVSGSPSAGAGAGAGTTSTVVSGSDSGPASAAPSFHTASFLSNPDVRHCPSPALIKRPSAPAAVLSAETLGATTAAAFAVHSSEAASSGSLLPSPDASATRYVAHGLLSTDPAGLSISQRQALEGELAGSSQRLPQPRLLAERSKVSFSLSPSYLNSTNTSGSNSMVADSEAGNRERDSGSAALAAAMGVGPMPRHMNSATLSAVQHQALTSLHRGPSRTISLPQLGAYSNAGAAAPGQHAQRSYSSFLRRGPASGSLTSGGPGSDPPPQQQQPQLVGLAGVQSGMRNLHVLPPPISPRGYNFSRQSSHELSGSSVASYSHGPSPSSAHAPTVSSPNLSAAGLPMHLPGFTHLNLSSSTLPKGSRTTALLRSMSRRTSIDAHGSHAAAAGGIGGGSSGGGAVGPGSSGSVKAAADSLATRRSMEATALLHGSQDGPGHPTYGSGGSGVPGSHSHSHQGRYRPQRSATFITLSATTGPVAHAAVTRCKTMDMATLRLSAGGAGASGYAAPASPLGAGSLATSSASGGGMAALAGTSGDGSTHAGRGVAPRQRAIVSPPASGPLAMQCGSLSGALLQRRLGEQGSAAGWESRSGGVAVPAQGPQQRDQCWQKGVSSLEDKGFFFAAGSSVVSGHNGVLDSADVQLLAASGLQSGIHGSGGDAAAQAPEAATETEAEGGGFFELRAKSGSEQSVGGSGGGIPQIRARTSPQQLHQL